MKLVIIAGPPTVGKTAVIKQSIPKLLVMGFHPAFLKFDVQYANEDTELGELYGIPTKKVFSGELCPDHCNAVVLGDAVTWAGKSNADVLIIESAGLCFRCSPYVNGGLGMAVLEATSGMNLPRKVGPLLSLADVVAVTKIDLISQAEREVFRANIRSATGAAIVETDALHGINIDRIVRKIAEIPDIPNRPLMLRGNPPVGVCTICVGKKDIGWDRHFGVVRSLETGIFYRGE